MSSLELKVKELEERLNAYEKSGFWSRRDVLKSIGAGIIGGTALISTASAGSFQADMQNGEVKINGIALVKTTAGQTINVATAAELTAALAALAAAPSLLGNIIIQFAAGTYANAVAIPSLIGNGFSLTLQGGTTTNLTTTATSGTAGTISTQATVVKTGAGWTVNAYRGQWLEFTSGALAGKIRLINSNTSDTLTLVGSFFNSAPQNGNGFIIRSNNVTITGDITVPPSTCELKLTKINISGLNSNLCKITMTEVKQSVSGYFNYSSEFTSFKYFRCYFLNSAGVNGLWHAACNSTFFQCYGYGDTSVYSWFILSQGGGQSLIRCGSTFDNYVVGEWSSIGGVVNNNQEGGEDTQADNNTYNQIKNSTTGILANSGGHVAGGVYLCIFTGNVTDRSAEAASYSWIG